MPFTSTGNGKYRSPSGRTFTKKQVKMYYATDGFTKKKKKPEVTVNNKLKGALGASEFKKGNKPTGRIEINVKKHKGDKRELASTIKHEMMHIKHPKMTEKEVYKRTAKTKIDPKEQKALLAKLQQKKSNYKMGAVKRKIGMGPGDYKPGEMIAKMNERKMLAIKGLV